MEGHNHAANDMDDVFGSAPSSPTLFPNNPRGNSEPSEIPRMRSVHSTAGYRDGLTAAKGKTIQDGFDEGYSLGATVGLRVGAILGVLEGLLSAALKNEASKPAAEDTVQFQVNFERHELETERLRNLLGRAREELKTEGTFGTEYWSSDGVWTYEVQERGGGWKDVVDAHPLIQSWENIIEEEATKAALDLTVMDHFEAKRLGEGQQG
jgi:hypothetical protein